MRATRAYRNLRMEAHGWFNHCSEGSQRVARFCLAVKEGERPAREDEDAIAAALELLLGDSGSSIDRATHMLRKLGLLRKQGRGVSERSKQGAAVRSVLRYLDRVEAVGEAEAIKVQAQESGVCVRAMRQRVAKWKDTDQLQVMQAEAEMIRAIDAHLSAGAAARID